MNQVDNKPQSATAQANQGRTVTWVDNLTIQCEGVRLQLTQGLNLRDSSAEVVSLFKDPSFVRDYVQCLEGVETRNVMDIGIKHGGSAIFFWNLLQPDTLCCVELNGSAQQLSAYIERQGLGERLRTWFDTDQGDKTRLRDILANDFGEAPLDVVIDDASHLYTPSLATFEVLFPRLRPGGLYFLEDWKVHATLPQHGREPRGAEPPLHRLVHELLDISLLHPELIARVRCHHNFVIFERGEATVDASGLDIRSMLAADNQTLEH